MFSFLLVFVVIFGINTSYWRRKIDYLQEDLDKNRSLFPEIMKFRCELKNDQDELFGMTINKSSLSYWVMEKNDCIVDYVEYYSREISLLEKLRRYERYESAFIPFYSLAPHYDEQKLQAKSYLMMVVKLVEFADAKTQEKMMRALCL